MASSPAKNTHLSVYIAIMKGEYDAILDWPFKKKVRVTLIDQQEDLVERENVVLRVSLCDHPVNCARPINEGNLSWGHHEFVSHKKTVFKALSRGWHFVSSGGSWPLMQLNFFFFFLSLYTLFKTLAKESLFRNTAFTSFNMLV